MGISWNIYIGMYQNQSCYIWEDEHPFTSIWGSLGYQSFDSYPYIYMDKIDEECQARVF